MNRPSLSAIPKTGLAGLKENWRIDLQSGFLVFLIALRFAWAYQWLPAFRRRQVLSRRLSGACWYRALAVPT